MVPGMGIPNHETWREQIVDQIIMVGTDFALFELNHLQKVLGSRLLGLIRYNRLCLKQFRFGTRMPNDQVQMPNQIQMFK
jgi:hypothetical protein